MFSSSRDNGRDFARRAMHWTQNQVAWAQTRVFLRPSALLLSLICSGLTCGKMLGSLLRQNMRPAGVRTARVCGDGRMAPSALSIEKA